ncbi:SDR family oxidoreductase [Streptomyces sp. NPDC002520]
MFQPAQAAARHWIREGLTGSITMTSSIAGFVGIPTLAPYAASKVGINQLVRTLAADWAPTASGSTPSHPATSPTSWTASPPTTTCPPTSWLALFTRAERRQHLYTSLASTRSSAEVEQCMASGSAGPCRVGRGPRHIQQRSAGTCPWMRSILANTAYRLLVA